MPSIAACAVTPFVSIPADPNWIELRTFWLLSRHFARTENISNLELDSLWLRHFHPHTHTRYQPPCLWELRHIAPQNVFAFVSKFILIPHLGMLKQWNWKTAPFSAFFFFNNNFKAPTWQGKRDNNCFKFGRGILINVKRVWLWILFN